jgi:hypothetical protein
MRANIVGPFWLTTRSRASTASCHSSICCSAFGSFWIYRAASLRVTSWRPRGRGIGSSNGRFQLGSSGAQLSSASKSESQQQSEHEHDQQCCRDRDDALCVYIKSPKADLKSIAHIWLSIEKLRAFGGAIYLSADLPFRQDDRRMRGLGERPRRPWKHRDTSANVFRNYPQACA